MIRLSPAGMAFRTFIPPLCWAGYVVTALAAASADLPSGTRETVIVQNDAYRVRWDKAGHFAVGSKATGRDFIVRGDFGPVKGPARAGEVDDPIFGHGQNLEVTDGDGDRYSIRVFPKLPFVLFRASLHNGGKAVMERRNLHLLSLDLDLKQSPETLRALGTAGLTRVDDHPGSYAYLAVADPETRRGVVGGWITHDRGNGVVFTSIAQNRIRLEAQVDYGRLRVAPGRSATSETFAVGYFDDARIGLERWADTVAQVYRIRLHPQLTGYCTWYSRPHGGASDETHLVELAQFVARELKPYGFDFIQIDDRWQMGQQRNGPAKNFTTNNPTGPYPHGMKPVAEKVSALGLKAGLWFMPFAGDHEDPYFKPHPDWFVRRAGGGFYETSWGGTSLDMTSPGARRHVEEVAKTIHGWGFDYFKMDGLWTGSATAQIYVCDGYRDDGMGDAVFHDPDTTNIEAMRNGLKLVREAAGPDVFFSGCNLSQNMRSLSGSVGLVDSMRIGPDNGYQWPKDVTGPVVGTLLAGPVHGSRKYFMHGRLWWNDPDPVYVRPQMPLNHARLIASWVAVSGQFYLCTDWLPGLPAERLDIIRRTIPFHGLQPRPVDLFEQPIPRIWLLTDTRTLPRRDVLALYNWDDHDQTISCALAKIGLDKETRYLAFDYWDNKLEPNIESRLNVTVPAQSCRILAVRPVSDHPQLLSTSRHVTQGMVDVTAENWDGARLVLSGRSKVVERDPYELRVAFPPEKAGWVLDRAEVSKEDAAAGVTVAPVKSEARLARVTLHSPVNREIQWSLHFRVSK
jgi:Melibiase